MISPPPDSKRSEVIFWVTSSICSSVGLVIVNKILMKKYGFNFVLTLTTMHFLCQWALMETRARTNSFQLKRMPMHATLFCAVAMSSSVVFMNFSLQFNTVGFYQMAKLACIPVTVVIEKCLFHKVLSRRIILTLAVIVAGVGCACVTDVGLNAVGFVMGVIAVFATVAYQIWAGNFQRKFQVNGQQYTHSVSPFITGSVAAAALVVEVIPMFGSKGESVLNHTLQPAEVGLIFTSCIFAIGVNVSTASLLRVTSAVTYQVVGHAKTILVLTGGFVLFPSPPPSSPAEAEGMKIQFIKNAAGIVTAMAGVVLYGHLKAAKEQQDICQAYCAGTWLVADTPDTGGDSKGEV